MREHGIPIDMIGGTSIGSLISGLYALSDEDVEHRAKSWFLILVPKELFEVLSSLQFLLLFTLAITGKKTKETRECST
ncbi:unnamed protein product [Gongylonema pulchrum]|uniref:PNPLA domain-containing protein n=1 Tax=Gongylonema pulchrum TaxID=637853 RepID=A0A183D2E5_9BILA|nr:unnamed protein product [Gongylonema pulchrum]